MHNPHYAAKHVRRSPRSLKSAVGSWGFLLGLFILSILIGACQTQPRQIFIDVDDGRQSLTTEAATVREALTEAKVELGPLDRVKPDLYAQLEPGLVIVVTRVAEEIETKREVVPFERQTITNEALATGETRLVQLGVNGEEEISVRVVYENGKEVSRTEIGRQTVIEPIPEMLVVGPQGELPSVPVEGTVAYLANGNAWLMRDSSSSRRTLTTSGDLDGRVFTLSPDGRQLAYTTELTGEIELPLNELWLASTTIVGEKPITTGIRGVLQAAWSPVISQSILAYTTAERTANPPGWRAHNDLWLLDLSEPRAAPENLLPPNTEGLYAWWGTAFTWSPDGTRLAYARADQIGIIDLASSQPISDTITPLMEFTPLKTFSEWVWVPHLSWSPDGQFIAAAVHGEPLASEPPEESQVFDLWLLRTDGTISANVAQQVGMWANPAWGENGIAYGEAFEPLQSVNSRYSIQLMDRDGSNKHQLFPFQEELGVKLPELVWGPSSDELLFTYNGNLYLASGQGSPPKQLTVDGQASQPQWVSTAPLMTAGTGITTSGTITGSGIITSDQTLRPTASRSTAITRTPGPQIRNAPTSPLATPTSSSGSESASSTPDGSPAPSNEATVAPTRSISPTITRLDNDKGNDSP